jgi:hypothetical protein
MKIADTETGTTDTTAQSEREGGSTDGAGAQTQGKPETDQTTDTTAAETARTELREREEESELPLDQVFDILKNKRRRTVLRYLNAVDGSVKLGTLSEHVAAIENDIDEVAVSSDQRKRVYVGLYQCHLPKMDDMDIIEFNQDRGIIELGANADQLDDYLALADDSTRDWHKYYGGIAVLGPGIMAATIIGSGFGFTPLVGFAVVNLLLLSTSLAHLYER